jgi:hypothetical protein
MAWNHTGHRVVALVAYKTLDATTKAKIAKILKGHPAADSLWQDRDINSPDDAIVNLFMNAATFPDDARPPSPGGFSSFHRKFNHYVNFRLDKDGMIGAAEGPGNLLLSYKLNLQATTSGVEVEDRAVALSWVFHQVGDAHQPLHAVARFSDAFPQGDEGGNLVKPFPNHRGPSRELHAFWDDLIGSATDVNTFDELNIIATDVMTKFPASQFGDDVKNLDIASWCKDEGAPVARDTVYAALSPAIDNQNGFHTLPANYEAQATAKAKERVALAGYRLAQQLKALVAD